MLLIWIIVLLFTVLLFACYLHYRKFSLLNRIPGPKSYLILGNMPIMTKGVFKLLPNQFPEVILQTMLGLGKLYDGIFTFWMGMTPNIIIYKSDTIEAILSSNSEIGKSFSYDYISPWLGAGLITSKGKKWHSRRKMLTSTFHFKIIDDFIPVINKQSKILINKLNANGNVEDIVKLIAMCALDVICETAMGVTINAQDNSESDYVKAITFTNESVVHRTFDIRGKFDSIYYKTDIGKQFLNSVNILHSFTRNVIKNKKQQIMNSNKSVQNNDDDDSIGRKKRSALLDLLLERHLSDPTQFTEEDIREEVDTFMFAGHDTTTFGICWTLYLLGLYDEHQQNVYDELNYIFGDDRERPITGEDIKSMKYLECCIKEALRLYPSVPMIGRELKDDFQIKGYTVPKGTTILINIVLLHRNSEVFPNPEIFDPNRFLPEESSKRHPYAYIPFSAGPRNCIGQRFALTEEKIILADILRNFRIKSLDERDRMRIGLEVILRPRNPMRMTFYKR